MWVCGLVMGTSDVLICEGSDLLLFYLIVGIFLLVLLPVLTPCGGLNIGMTVSRSVDRLTTLRKGQDNTPS